MSAEGWVCKTTWQFDQFVNHIRSSWDWSKPISIKWTDYVTKTTGQNNLVHAWFGVIAAYLNQIEGSDIYTKEDLKDYLKKEFGIRKTFIEPITKKEIQKLKSLGEYEKGEMTVFMNNVSEFAARINCLLPIWGEYEDLRGAA